MPAMSPASPSSPSCCACWRPSIPRGARRAPTRRRRCAMNEPAMDVIRCTGLGKTYEEGDLRTPVFDGLDLSVRRGETVAIVGASGAGKSTLLHLLGGLDRATAGEVYVADPASVDPHDPDDDGLRAMSALRERERSLLRNR